MNLELILHLWLCLSFRGSRNRNTEDESSVNIKRQTESSESNSTIQEKENIVLHYLSVSDQISDYEKRIRELEAKLITKVSHTLLNL